MTTVLIDKSGPFTHAPTSVQKTMTTVLWALAPATVFNAYLFGWPAIFLFIVTVGSCLLVEAACLQVQGRSVSGGLSDGSAALTGWLLAMSLPPYAPWWIGLLGGIFAIALAKHAYGGLGQNVFNPAMIARVALLVSFPVQMTSFVVPAPLFAAGGKSFADGLAVTFGGGADVVSSASALGLVKTNLSLGIPVPQSMDKVPDLLDMLLGIHPGSMGETSALLILAGGLFLLWKRIISWHTPVAVIGTVFVMGTVFNLIDPGRFANGTFHVLSGATLLGAFFIATDYVTSPVSKKGQIVFGIGLGVLTWLIRTFAGYPEGMAFAVLLMNSVAPIIDQHTRPRAFGRTVKGEPLPLKGDK